jgi:uncharacterized protein YigA (DUF484 family)
MTDLSVNNHTEADTSPHLDASQVVDYLLKHPAFFQEHEYLLADLILPHPKNGAISLVERQAAVMRERNGELRSRLGQLIQTARENDRIFQLIRKLGLALLEADTLEEAARAIRHAMLNEFKMQGCSLVIFDQPQLHSNELYSETTRDAAHRILGKLLRGERVICTALREDELRYLFPNYEGTAGSAAIIPLHFHHELGVMAIVSDDPAHFEPNMDTTFVAYIGQIIARRLAGFLKHRPDKVNHG